MIYITQNNFPVYFRQYANMVYRIAYGITANPQEAEDIVMICFEKLIDKIEFSSEEHIKAWLIKTAEHKSLNVVSSARFKRNIPLESVPETAASQEPSESSELLDMVFKLPDKLKTVVYLFYYEDMSAAGIAKALKISENTVYKRLSRGRKLLKMNLEEGRV